MTYNEFRHLADSWGLVFMGVTYVMLVGWALLPRNRDTNRAAALMILDEKPAAKEQDNG
ncbi:MAG: cbb3-type cytochrome c oxidase subunit 3 [Proteobacteria bacterium]|nr:cbb3-type cytochrome c oxidase subunit 3 [Pseudomonadota bacterium]